MAKSRISVPSVLPVPTVNVPAGFSFWSAPAPAPVAKAEAKPQSRSKNLVTVLQVLGKCQDENGEWNVFIGNLAGDAAKHNPYMIMTREMPQAVGTTYALPWPNQGCEIMSRKRLTRLLAAAALTRNN